MSALAIENLVVNRTGIPVVRGVNLIAKAGEISVLLGSNGAGKTTLLEGISGSFRPAGALRSMAPISPAALPATAPAPGSAMSNRGARCSAK